MFDSIQLIYLGLIQTVEFHGWPLRSRHISVYVAGIVTLYYATIFLERFLASGMLTNNQPVNKDWNLDRIESNEIMIIGEFRINTNVA